MIDGSSTFWSIKNGKLMNKPILGNSANPAYSFELQNQTYFIPKYDGSIIKWDYALSTDPTIIMGIDAVQMTAFSVYEDIIFLFKKGDGFLKYNTSSEAKAKIDITGYYSNVVVVIDDIIFSGNNDSTITKYSMKDLKILSSTKAHDTEVTVLAGNGPFVVSGGNDAVLKKWDRASMNLVLVMRREIGNLGHLGGITSIFIMDDVLFSGSVDTTAKKWDLSTGKVQFTYTGHIKKVRCVYYHNSSLFTSGEDGLIQMFTVILPKPISFSVPRTTALASRINPTLRPDNVNENATLSSFELVLILVGIAVALILSIFIFVRARSLKKQSQTPDSSGKFSSAVARGL
jgi:WD40 repeat protein